MDAATYEEALEASRAATRAFSKAQMDYRAKKIGDAEFLAAREIHNAASIAFDRAAEARQDAISAEAAEAERETPEQIIKRLCDYRDRLEAEVTRLRVENAALRGEHS